MTNTSESISITVQFPVSAEKLYRAWLDSGEHTSFTGGEAEATAEVNGEFTAWDGYIWGINKELNPGMRILQTWRTTEFEESDEDSLLELLFEDSENGCVLTLNHTNIPEGQCARYEKGWEEHYFEPMREYFTLDASQKAVIFDWSGTLSDNFHLFCKVVEHIFDDYGKEHISVEEVQRTFTLPYMKFWNHHLPELTKEKQDELYTKYIHEVGEPELFAGVTEMMDSLHQAGIQLFILSSDPITKLQPEIDKSGFAQYIAEVTGNVHDKDEVIERYITDHGLGSHRVFYIGDTSGDVEAGQSAGVETIAVTWGFQHNNVLAQSNPDYLLSEVAQITKTVLG